MKTINNVETDLPLDEWLHNEKDNSNIVVKTRDETFSNQCHYKKNLEENLKGIVFSSRDIMEIWDFSAGTPKLLWKRG